MMSKYYTPVHHPSFYQDNTRFSFDRKKVLLHKIPYTTEYTYFPVHIALYALSCYQHEQFNDFNNQIQYLHEELTEGVWLNQYTPPYYSVDIPWVHGIAQSMGLSALLRAYDYTGERCYKDDAVSVLQSYDRSVVDKGIRYEDEYGVWFEEYALTDPPHVLNGFLFTLFGLYELYIYADNLHAKELFDVGCKTLMNTLCLFDTGKWSLYRLNTPHLSPLNYHRLHINQLHVLYQLSGIVFFNKIVERWKNYLNSFNCRWSAFISRNVDVVKKKGLFTSCRLGFNRWRWLHG